MSELSKAEVAKGIIPNDERYRRYFGRLPLQATLNMLYAYRPVGGTEREANMRRVTEAVRSHLLVEGQATRAQSVNLDKIPDTTLKYVSDYLWAHPEMKDKVSYRVVGETAVDIAARQIA